MRGDVLGVERRRRWSDEEKLEIVQSVGVGGATLTQVAQRHEISRSQIYSWRHELKKKGLWSPDHGAVFLPVEFGDAVPVPTEPASVPPVAVELRLSNGRCLRFDSSLDGDALTRLIRAVEAA
jgi:transposase